MDFDRDVTEFGRNTERLRCRCKGKTYQLTPELFLVYGGERMLLHCAPMDKLHVDAFTQLRESYPIKLWTEKTIVESVESQNIDLIRRYHLGKLFQRSREDYEKYELDDQELTAELVARKTGYSLPEASRLLLEQVAYRLLWFDVSQPFTYQTKCYRWR